jgi:hypothetical protein
MMIKRKFARYAAEQARRAGLAPPARLGEPFAPAPSSSEPEPEPSSDPAAAHLGLLLVASAPDPVTAIEPDPDAATTVPPLVEPERDVAMFNSTNIRGAELDVASGVLEVEFTNGKRYRYGNFTRELLDAWRGAESAGKWFNTNVKAQPDKHPLLTGR